jgi:hypothetical protein
MDNANLLLTQHRLKLAWNQMVWSVNNLRCGTAGSGFALLLTFAIHALVLRVDNTTHRWQHQLTSCQSTLSRCSG